MRASHILLEHQMRWPPSKQRHPRTQARAEELLGQLRDQIVYDGADFGDLASQYSDCPSRQDGGDLGRFGPGQMARRFEDATQALGVGELSDIVHTEFGVHLILRTE